MKLQTDTLIDTLLMIIAQSSGTLSHAELCWKVISENPEYYQRKIEQGKKADKSHLHQISAEVGASKKNLQKQGVIVSKPGQGQYPTYTKGPKFNPIKAHLVKTINNYECATFKTLDQARACVAFWETQHGANITYFIFTNHGTHWSVYVGQTNNKSRLNPNHPYVDKDKEQIFVVLHSLYRGQDLIDIMEAMGSELMRKGPLKVDNIHPTDKSIQKMFAKYPENELVTVMEIVPILTEYFNKLMKKYKMAKVIIQSLTKNPKIVSKGNRFSFTRKGIKNGDLIFFIGDSKVKVKVVGERDVEYEGKVWKLSPLVAFLFQKMGTMNNSGAYQGANYFTFKGIRLTELSDIS